MEGEDEDSTDNRAFGKKPVWGRMSVVFAGPFFNFILAFIFAFILMSCVGYDKAGSFRGNGRICRRKGRSSGRG